MVVRFDGAMRASGETRPKTVVRFVAPENGGAAARAPRASRLRIDADDASSTRAVIVSSLFLVVLASALLLGGHAAIDPLLRSAMAAREAHGVGDVVYTMPDGVYCRHLSFDNATAEVAESAIERCSNDIVGDRVHSSRGFAWGR